MTGPRILTASAFVARSLLTYLLPLFTYIDPAKAQTYTLCDPLAKDCPANAALGAVQLSDFTKGNGSLSNFRVDTTNATQVLQTRDNLGVLFVTASENDALTLTTPKYIFFGRIDVEMQCAPGNGIVTSLVLQSDCLDEIDFEFVGGDKSQCQSNYFSKGNTSIANRGAYHPVDFPARVFHTYSVNWTSDAVQWLVDGVIVRVVTNTDAQAAGGFPQTPMQIKLGTWVAKGTAGTIEWAGGPADFSHGPFEAIVRSIRITDYGGGFANAVSYSYGDKSGSWQSIKVTTADNSTQAPTGTGTSTGQGVQTSAAAASGGNLAPGAIAGIAVGGVVGLAVFGLAVFLWRRRMARAAKVAAAGTVTTLALPTDRDELHGNPVSELESQAANKRVHELDSRELGIWPFRLWRKGSPSSVSDVSPVSELPGSPHDTPLYELEGSAVLLETKPTV